MQRGALEIGSSPELVDPPHPLAPYGDVEYAAKQIHRLAHFPHAGDLIVLGEITEEGDIMTFETQMATHGAIGGPQSEPFIAWPSDRDLQPDALNDSEDLYRLFMRYQKAAS